MKVIFPKTKFSMNKMPSGLRAENSPSILVNLGKKTKKEMKKIRKGKGPVGKNIEKALAKVVNYTGGDVEGKTFVPIVVVYKDKDDKDKKKKNKAKNMAPWGMLG